MQCHPPLKHRRELQARVSPLSTSQLAPDLHKELRGVASQNVSLAQAATLTPTIQSKPAALGRAAGYLHRMQPRLGASNSFHGRHSHMMQGADGGQAGIGRKVAGTQIKVIPLTTQAIRADPSAGSERFVMLRVTSPHSTLCSLFRRDPHLSTRARARAPPLSCGGTHWCTLGLWAGAWKPGALSAASYSGRSWRLS